MKKYFEKIGHNGLILRGIIVATIIAIWPSMKHVAYSFNTLESSNNSGAFGWFAAMGIESGLFWVQFALAEKIKHKDYSLIKIMIICALFLLCINIYCNYDAGIAGFLGKANWTSYDLEQALSQVPPVIDSHNILKVQILGAGLPVVSLILIIVYTVFSFRKHSDEVEEQKKQNKIDREKKVKAIPVKPPRIEPVQQSIEANIQAMLPVKKNE